MNIKIIKAFLLISFFFCYLEWGNNQSAFIFEVVFTLFTEKFSLSNFSHPIILIGLISVIVLVISLFTTINQKLEKLIIILLTILVVFFLFIGTISLRYKIILSTLPFLFLTNLYFIKNKKGSI